MRQPGMIELTLFKNLFAFAIGVDFDDPRPAIGINIGFLSIAISWGREKGAPLFAFTNHWKSE